jgi:CO/xanthine dehydrogenase FAD-binding subunit
MTTDGVHYVVPDTVEACLRELASSSAPDDSPGLQVLAGGTDLLPRLGRGLLPPPTGLVNLKGIPELKGIQLTDDGLRLGATTTIAEIQESSLLTEQVPVLASAANQIACGQIRNMGTIGGNVCNASPAGDLIPSLLVLEAQACLASWNGSQVVQRMVPLAELFVGPGRVALQPGELLMSLNIPRPPSGLRAAFRKFRRRPAMDVATVSVAAAAEVAGPGEPWTGVRVAYGAVAPTPVRGMLVEKLLEGQVPSESLFQQAAQVAHEEVRPIDDVRGGAVYRRELVAVLLQRALREVATGAGGSQ